MPPDMPPFLLPSIESYRREQDGLCGCGCGEPTPIARATRRELGQVKGQPMRFRIGHATRGDHARMYTVDENGCWLWTGRTNTSGYGQFNRDGVTHVAHRWFYEQHIGPVPDGMELDHLCRVRSCVNPRHLEPVTGAENIRRGRVPKLTKEHVAEIRRSAEPSRVLAERFGIGRNYVTMIRRPDSPVWRGVT